jgi:hypothetical protein
MAREPREQTLAGGTKLLAALAGMIVARPFSSTAPAV